MTCVIPGRELAERSLGSVSQRIVTGIGRDEANR